MKEQALKPLNKLKTRREMHAALRAHIKKLNEIERMPTSTTVLRRERGIAAIESFKSTEDLLYDLLDIIDDYTLLNFCHSGDMTEFIEHRKKEKIEWITTP